MSKIFISYRRSDSRSITGRITDRLKDHFKTEEVFMDVEKIPPGVNFLDFTNQRLRDSEVVIPIIGPTWAKSLKDREKDNNDFVRIEIEEALKNKLKIVPILVENAQMPSAEELPASIRDMVYTNSMPIRPDPDFESDTAKLIDFLKTIVSKDALKPKEKKKSPLSSKLAYGGLGALVLLGLLIFFATRETCDYPKTGVLVADFQADGNDPFANSVLTQVDANLMDSLFDVRSVGFQPRDKQNYKDYVEEEFFSSTCTPAGVFVNGFLSSEDEVFNLYTSFVNLDVGMPEYLKDQSLVLSNPSNIQFSIREDSKFLSDLIVSIVKIHDSKHDEALKTLSELFEKARGNKELQASIAFFKGQCYALNGDEIRATREYKKGLESSSVEIADASKLNIEKANQIKELYLKFPETANIRLQNLRNHRSLENEILNLFRKTIRKRGFGKLLGI